MERGPEVLHLSVGLDVGGPHPVVVDRDPAQPAPLTGQVRGRHAVGGVRRRRGAGQRAQARGVGGRGLALAAGGAEQAPELDLRLPLAPSLRGGALEEGTYVLVDHYRQARVLQDALHGGVLRQTPPSPVVADEVADGGLPGRSDRRPGERIRHPVTSRRQDRGVQGVLGQGADPPQEGVQDRLGKVEVLVLDRVTPVRHRLGGLPVRGARGQEIDVEGGRGGGHHRTSSRDARFRLGVRMSAFSGRT